MHTALESAPGPHRQEILYALRRIQETDTAAWNTAPILDDTTESTAPPILLRCLPATLGKPPRRKTMIRRATWTPEKLLPQRSGQRQRSGRRRPITGQRQNPGTDWKFAVHARDQQAHSPGCAADHAGIDRRADSGSGKELVAEALHKLSTRSRKPFVAINCAAIPEALLEAELFGHTRGAFTGAVQGRVGRIEAADGGTLFLDEIGEMPLGLQSKLLRFVESGELQRVGDNETTKVDVRIIAATHQPLAQHTQAGSFRADLYYRLAVFLVRTPGAGGAP